MLMSDGKIESISYLLVRSHRSVVWIGSLPHVCHGACDR